MTDPTDLVFVYGTLRRDFGHAAHARFLAGAEFVGHATAPGRLYDLGPYPCMVAAPKEDDADAGHEAATVRGEIYRLTGPATLGQLDVYEGCDPADPRAGAGEYRRVGRPATLDTGVRVEVWVYLYNRALPPGARRVRSGDICAANEDI